MKKLIILTMFLFFTGISSAEIYTTNGNVMTGSDGSMAIRTGNTIIVTPPIRFPEIKIQQYQSEPFEPRNNINDELEQELMNDLMR